jgi:hypothetical protein
MEQIRGDLLTPEGGVAWEGLYFTIEEHTDDQGATTWVARYSVDSLGDRPQPSVEYILRLEDGRFGTCVFSETRKSPDGIGFEVVLHGVGRLNRMPGEQ